LRIGIDYTSAVHQKAGIGRYTRGLVNALAKLESGHEYVLIITGGGDQGPEAPVRDLASRLPSNFQIKGVPFSDRFWAVVWHRVRLPLPLDLFTGSVQLFHSPDYVLPPLRSGKKVVTIHDLSFLRYPEGAEPSLRRYLERAVPNAVERADLVLADSQNTKGDIVELLGAPPEKVEVLFPGVDERFRPLEDEQLLERTRTLYDLSFPFILFVGTLEPRKNLARLLDAYATLRRLGEISHRLVIAGGTGWLYEGIFRRAEELSLGSDVIFLGYVGDENLPALHNLADLFVFPSVYEGFGLPPLEAMACGTPVIASDSSSLPEVVGEAGLLVPSDDHEALAEAMRRVLSDPALREDLVSRGLRQASRFTWGRAGQQLLSTYERLLDSPQG